MARGPHSRIPFPSRSPDSEHTLARPAAAYESSPTRTAAPVALTPTNGSAYLDSSDVLAFEQHGEEHEEEDSSDSERTRSPRESYLALAALPISGPETGETAVREEQAPPVARSQEEEDHEEEPTRSPRESYLDLAALAPTRETESPPPRSLPRALGALPGLAGAGPVLSQRRPSFVAAEELQQQIPVAPPSRMRTAQMTLPPRTTSAANTSNEVIEFRARFTSPDSETGYAVPPQAPPHQKTMPIRLEQRPAPAPARVDRESVTNYNVRPSYVAPSEVAGDYALLESDDGSYATSDVTSASGEVDGMYLTNEIEEVHEVHAAPPPPEPSNTEVVYSSISKPLDFDGLKRFLFDEPTPPPQDQIIPDQQQQQQQQHAHDGTMLLNEYQPAPQLQPHAIVRSPNLNLNLSVTPIHPVVQPAPRATHFLQPQLAQPRLPTAAPAQTERSQHLAQMISAVKNHLARHSLVARDPQTTPQQQQQQQQQQQSTTQNIPPPARSSSRPAWGSSVPPSPSSLSDRGIDSPWIVPTGPATARRAPRPPEPFRVTMSLVAAALIATLALGIVTTAVWLMRSDDSVKVTSTATPSKDAPRAPVPTLDNPPPPPVASTVVIAPPPVADPPPPAADTTATPPPTPVKPAATPKANAKAEAAAAKAEAAAAKAEAAAAAREKKDAAAADKSENAKPEKPAPSEKSAAAKDKPEKPAAAQQPEKPTARTKPAASSASTGKPKSVEQILDELGEEQLKR